MAESNFITLSNYLKRILEEDKNTYVLFSDGLEFYILKDFKQKCSEDARSRIINIGISEQNALSMAAGLALGGKIPYVIMFAPFMTMRAAEQIKLDICYCNANVKMIGTNAGYSGTGQGGYSHCAFEDIALFNALPNIKIYNPAPSKNEFEKILHTAHTTFGPTYIRINCAHAINDAGPQYPVEQNKIAQVIKGKGAAVIASGCLVEHATKLALTLKQQTGSCPSVYSAYCLKPFDESSILKLISQKIPIITLEEHGAGGLASIVAMIIAKSGKKAKFLPIYLKTDHYNFYASDKSFLKNILLNGTTLAEKFFELVKNKKFLFFTKKLSFNDKNELTISYNIFSKTYFMKSYKSRQKKWHTKYRYYLLGIKIL